MVLIVKLGYLKAKLLNFLHMPQAADTGHILPDHK